MFVLMKLPLRGIPFHTLLLGKLLFMLQKPKDMELLEGRNPPIYLVLVVPQCLIQVWAHNIFQEASLTCPLPHLCSHSNQLYSVAAIFVSLSNHQFTSLSFQGQKLCLLSPYPPSTWFGTELSHIRVCEMNEWELQQIPTNEGLRFSNFICSLTHSFTEY